MLTVDDFDDFFAQANEGHTPFPWQRRFLREVATRLSQEDHVGQYFPELVDLPTGAGKTSIIDIAVFLLALEAVRPLSERRLPRRIVFVVDRRIIVDQAHEHAQNLARLLANRETDSVAGRVAAALRTYSAGAPEGTGDEPLLATVLRGGTVRDETWAHRPDMPAVISSTVDQVGSRLLFRGYGLSPSMQPIHAGLLGSDTLFLLDEVHLSEPFAQTLRSLAADYQPNWAEEPMPSRWEVVELSATPGKVVQGASFRLAPEHGDFDETLNETLPRRLQALKPATLADPVKTKGSDKTEVANAFAKGCCKEVMALLEEPHISTLALVVNRVETAVAAYQLLNEKDIETVLLTGRMRPHDRDRLIRDEKIGQRLKIGRVRDGDQKPFVVVATQCIEAGADFDFDGLVTEAASLDALIQRFGRVDRDGFLSDRGTPARGVVVIKESDLKSEDDPVYGASLAKTWAAMDGNAQNLDFGISALPASLKEDLSLRVSRANAPILFPGHLDAWVQTNPKPTPDPDPKFWLHGPENSLADVTIVWRSDLSEELLRSALDDASKNGISNLEAIRALAVAARPGALESMSVPLAAASRWLGGQEMSSVSDVESVASDLNDNKAGYSKARPFVRWAGDQSEVVLLADRISSDDESNDSTWKRGKVRPGDTILVPAAYGGVGAHLSWDPTSITEVPDLAELTQLVQRHRAVVRLVPGVLRRPDGHLLASDISFNDADFPDATDRDRVLMWLEDHIDELSEIQQLAGRQILRNLRQKDRKAKRVSVEPISLNLSGEIMKHFVVTGPASKRDVGVELGSKLLEGESEDLVDSEPETSSFTSVAFALDDHLEGVGDWAKLLAANSGLPTKLVRDIELAGRLHDLGKADPRFQIMLRNGDPVAATGVPLAKSATPADTRTLREAARRRSGYPSGARHEVMSLAMIDGIDSISQRANDWDLVRHLVVSHHGFCRPFPPSVIDEERLVVTHSFQGVPLQGETDHGLERLDSGIADRFWVLVRRYGWYRLAWFEAILRLADHRRSECEQSQGASVDNDETVMTDRELSIVDQDQQKVGKI